MPSGDVLQLAKCFFPCVSSRKVEEFGLFLSALNLHRALTFCIMRSWYYAINIDIPSNIPFEEHAVKSSLGDIDQAPPSYPLAQEMEDDGSLL